MTDRERALFAAVESAVAAVLAIGGAFAVYGGGLLRTVGVALIVFGTIALGQAVAVGLGLLTPSFMDRSEDGDGPSR
jgi:hypothetical protein